MGVFFDNTCSRAVKRIAAILGVRSFVSAVVQPVTESGRILPTNIGNRAVTVPDHLVKKTAAFASA